MKKLFLIMFLVVTAMIVFAQNGARANEPDDEMNIFLLVFALVAISIMIGAAIIGAFAATMFLLLTVLFVSMGIISISLLAGFYKRSVTTAFKTFLWLVCMVAGMLIGAISFSIVSKFIELHISVITAFVAGAISGLIGGLLMAMIISRLIILSGEYFKKRFELL